MASTGIRRPDSPVTWQLAGTWLSGSLLMGTVALVFILSEHLSAPGPFPIGRAFPPIPIDPPRLRGPSLFGLTPVERLAVIACVAGLFVLLAAIAWLSAQASWLAGDGRASLLWALLVWGGGLAGWSYAAVATFATGFSAGDQIILAYTAGGLPFVLLAAMLLRPWQVTAAAAASAALLMAAGYLMVAGQVSPLNSVISVYADYARMFFAAQPALLY